MNADCYMCMWRVWFFNRHIIISYVRIPVSHMCFHLMHCHHPRNDYYITYDVVFLTFALWYQPSSWTLPPPHYHQRRHGKLPRNGTEASWDILIAPEGTYNARRQWWFQFDNGNQWQSIQHEETWRLFSCVSVASVCWCGASEGSCVSFLGPVRPVILIHIQQVVDNFSIMYLP